MSRYIFEGNTIVEGRRAVPVHSQSTLSVVVGRRGQVMKAASIARFVQSSLLHVPPTMSLSSTEQVVHDRINLGRLVKRIEKNATEDDWGPAGGKDTWVRAQGTLQVST